MAEKYLCVGDIHGRNDLLQRLLKRAEAEYPEHRLLFLGDYVDRGPDSFSVVDTIKKLCEAGRASAVMGNHEAMMIDYIKTGMEKPDIWLMNGGNKTMHSYMETTGDYTHRGFKIACSRSGHLDWLKSLPLFYETNEIWASHAPVSREAGEKGDFRNEPHDLYWTYEPVETISLESSGSFNHGKLAVCGHIHRLREKELKPRIYDHIVYCDTGCGCAAWGPLSGIIVEDGKYVSYFQEVPE